MSLIKSNSSLIAFDNSNLSNSDNFTFLNFIQSISINSLTNRVNQKSIGNKSLFKNQFVQPEIDLSISYYQRINFFNENLFGFNFVLEDLKYESFAKKLISDGFFNKNAFIIFSEQTIDDFAERIISSDYNQEMITVSIGNLFLNSYSFSYKIGSIPLVNASFSASQLKISKLTHATNYKIQNWDDSLIVIDKNSVRNYLFETNPNYLINSGDSLSKKIIYQMKYFSFSNNFQSTSTPGPAIDNFLNGVIQSFEFSIDLSRNKFYFFESGNVPSDRKIILPIKSKFKISGISKDFELGNLKNLFNTDEKFSSIISIGDSEDNNADYYKILLDDITVESFDYSININGFLEYTIDCSIDITDEKGFRVQQVNTKRVILLQDKNSDFLLSSEGYFLGTIY
jgi:hypothetical protein